MAAFLTCIGLLHAKLCSGNRVYSVPPRKFCGASVPWAEIQGREVGGEDYQVSPIIVQFVSTAVWFLLK